MERSGEYLLADLRDYVGGKNGEIQITQGVVLYVWSEKAYTVIKSRLNSHAIQQTGAKPLSTPTSTRSTSVSFAGAPSVQFKIYFELPLSDNLPLHKRIRVIRTGLKELWTNER